MKAETGFKGERERIDFTAFGYVPKTQDAKRSEQRELAYFLDDDPKTGRRSLIRREDPTLDDDFETGGRELVLLAGVTALEFQYWDKTTEAWKEAWDFEDAASGGKLPERVRIELTVEMDDGVEQTFVTQARVFLVSPLAFQQ